MTEFEEQIRAAKERYSDAQTEGAAARAALKVVLRDARDAGWSVDDLVRVSGFSRRWVFKLLE